MEDEKIKRDMELYAVDRLDFILENTSQPIITVNIAMLQRMGYKQITTDPAIGEKVFGIDGAVFMTMQELGAFETVTEKFSKDLGVGRFDTTLADLMMYRKIMEPTADYFTVTIDRSYAEKLIERVRKDQDKQKTQFILPAPSTDYLSSGASFDKSKSEIVIGDIRIKIPQNTNQSGLCEMMLKSERTKKKEWNYDEFMEKFGGHFGDKDFWRKIYGAAREVNKRVALVIHTEDFYKTTTKTIKLNPTFI